MGERDGLVAVIDQRRNRLVDVPSNTVLVGIGRNRVASDNRGEGGQRFERSSVERRNRSVLMGEAERAITIVNNGGDGLLDVEAGPIFVGVGRDEISGGNRVRHRGQRLERRRVDRRDRSVLRNVAEGAVAVVDQRRHGLENVDFTTVFVRIAADDVSGAQRVVEHGRCLKRRNRDARGDAIFVRVGDGLGDNVVANGGQRFKIVDVGTRPRRAAPNSELRVATREGRQRVGVIEVTREIDGRIGIVAIAEYQRVAAQAELLIIGIGRE